ncbi:hypothetical protein Cva_00295 [Caedimonas varicaedens]|uniref:Addiction module antidote protein n=1 Tax=Caedimonas varicaedens TaxID=1629334 RepID=A0A0K8MCP0_9PROT|nr:hypothetical protein Cva_00295 [Caedimonas varicaedens]
MKKSVSYKDYLSKSLKDPSAAAEYLNAALEEGNEAFTLALKDVVKALGGSVSHIASQANLNRESLYKTLSVKGNPHLRGLNAIIKSLGLQLHITPRP